MIGITFNLYIKLERTDILTILRDLPFSWFLICFIRVLFFSSYRFYTYYVLFIYFCMCWSRWYYIFNFKWQLFIASISEADWLLHMHLVYCKLVIILTCSRSTFGQFFEVFYIDDYMSSVNKDNFTSSFPTDILNFLFLSNCIS